ncbi:hypothetical protein K502DRAFT_351674 [Neoconidiobolus thromboides FSU 785]|nr:hypothetical protein K502DRAFT_351674 [Neoconidiobolus thromboides FSU 785]
MLYEKHPGLPISSTSLITKQGQMSPDMYLAKLTKKLMATQVDAFSALKDSKIKRYQQDMSQLPSLAIFKIGNIIYLYPSYDQSRKNKLALKWDGPYEVIHKHLYDSYSIKHKRTSVIYNRVHAKFLKSAM